MARATIELIKGLTHRAHGRILRLNYPKTITDSAEILYYKGISTVKVTILDDKKPKKVIEKPSKETIVDKKQKEVKTSEEEAPEKEAPEEEAPEDNDDEDGDGDEVSKESSSGDDEKKQDEKPNKTAFTEESLRFKSKQALIDIAVDMGTYADSDDKKKAIIKTILEAQEG